MNKNLPLVIGGIVFCLVALIHALRLYYQWEIQVDGYLIPMSASIIGLVVAGILALWMFIAASKN